MNARERLELPFICYISYFFLGRILPTNMIMDFQDLTLCKKKDYLHIGSFAILCICYRIIELYGILDLCILHTRGPF